MKTFLRVVSVVWILLLALPFALRLRMIQVENGEPVLLYVPVDGGYAGGSVGVYLLKELESVYGDAENPKGTKGLWQGKTVVIEETAEYTLEYKGKEVWDTGEYLEGTIVIWRDIKDPVTGEELASGVSLARVLGYDDGDLNSEEPAHILWETLQDMEFHGSGFDAVPVS